MKTKNALTAALVMALAPCFASPAATVANRLGGMAR